MKTQIVIAEGWRIIKDYDFLITLTTNDIIEFKGLEYKVDCCILEIEKNQMTILIKE